MKNLGLCFAFVAVLSVLLLQVEGASMPKCPDECDTSKCPVVSCDCGTVKDVCNCCEFCRVCPGAECHLIRSDVCAEGHSCTHPEGMDYVERMNTPGTCLRSETEQ